MKGTYKVVVKNRRVTYTVNLERSLTIIRGDSATGKTSLIASLAAYEELREKSGVSVTCRKECRILRNSDWEEKLHRHEDCIFFADEGCSFITSEAFARAIRHTGHYYVLITRESLYQLPYSVNSVLELKKSASRFKHTYNRTYPYYHVLPDLKQKISSSDLLITEDSAAGYEWFSFIAGQNGISCISSDGKTGILKKLKETESSSRIVIADGAAFGAEMEQVYQYLLLHPQGLILYLPESFEWLILKADILRDPEILSILESPSSYVDSSEFFSWETFFTDLQIKKSAGTQLQYSKRKLNPQYLREDCARRMLEVIEKG